MRRSSSPGPRKLTSIVIGIVAFIAAVLFLFPTGCAEVEGMSNWERCTTWVGTPAFSLTDWWSLNNQFDIVLPLFVGGLAGLIAWWLLGLRISDGK
jgi:hypothetical protein